MWSRTSHDIEPRRRSRGPHELAAHDRRFDEVGGRGRERLGEWDLQQAQVGDTAHLYAPKPVRRLAAPEQVAYGGRGVAGFLPVEGRSARCPAIDRSGY